MLKHFVCFSLTGATGTDTATGAATKQQSMAAISQHYRVARFLLVQDTKNVEKCTKWPKNIPNGLKIDQMVIKYAKIFHFKTLQNLPKVGFLFCKLNIGQP
jgi:hypothetical protein